MQEHSRLLSPIFRPPHLMFHATGLQKCYLSPLRYHSSPHASAGDAFRGLDGRRHEVIKCRQLDGRFRLRLMAGYFASLRP